VDPLGHCAIRSSHLGDRREHVGLPVCLARARATARSRLHLLGARRAPLMLGDMTIQRMDNVGIVVDDLDAAVAFFTEHDKNLEAVQALGLSRRCSRS
jgi:hypothetical protein